MILHEQRGSSRIGKSFWLAFKASYPIGKLIIEDNKIIVKVWPFKAIVYIYDVDYVQVKGDVIRIFHHGLKYPYIRFSAFKIDEALNTLKKIGVKCI